MTAVAPARPTEGLVALTVATEDGSASAWFTYGVTAIQTEEAPPQETNCVVTITPSAPGERVVVPFPATCGIESVVVQLPASSGPLQLNVGSLARVPDGLQTPLMAAPPSVIFEATLRDESGAEVQPGSAILQVRIPSAWVDACVPPQCRPSLFHYHQGNWTNHDLTTVDEENGTLVMEAKVNGFSLFAVAGAATVPASGLPLWAWPVGAIGAVGVVSAPIVLVHGRRKRKRMTVAAQAQEEVRVGQLMAEMRNKEELLSFVNAAAHDLANPLTPIQLQLDLLSEASAMGASEAEQAEALGVVRSNVEQLESLIKDLRDASKLQSGKLRLVPTDMDLAELATDITKTYEAQADKAGVEFVAKVFGPIPVHADRAQLRRVFTNFVSNALKFTPKGGRVELSAHCDDQEAFVHVADSGLGLTSADIERLFKPFSQVHSEKEKAKGTGLGLFISKGIVEASGGHIGCTSAGHGQGATFWFTLPLRAGMPKGDLPAPTDTRPRRAADTTLDAADGPGSDPGAQLSDLTGPRVDAVLMPDVVPGPVPSPAPGSDAGTATITGELPALPLAADADAAGPKETPTQGSGAPHGPSSGSASSPSSGAVDGKKRDERGENAAPA